MSKPINELVKTFEKKFDKKISEFNWYEWHIVSVYQVLTEEFMREFKDKVWWYWIFLCQKLSYEFIEEFIDRIDRTDVNNLNKHNKINYLKYKLKSNKITEKEYLKELLKI